MKTKKTDNYLMIAAFLMTASSLYWLYDMFVSGIIADGAELVINYYLSNISLSLVINLIWYIAMPIALFIKNKRFIALISGLQVLKSIYYLVINIGYGNPNIDYYIRAISALLIYISLSVLLYSAYKEKDIVSKIWYLPSLCYVIYLVIDAIIVYIQYIIPGIIQSFNLLGYASGIVQTLILFFLGLWVKNDLSLLAHTVKGGADELIAYKNMLDSGEITQEEFEAKKKEIIG